MFGNLERAIKNRNETEARKYANAILRKYNVNRFTVNKNTMARIIYALRLKQFNGAAHNMTGPQLWQTIKDPAPPRSRL